MKRTKLFTMSALLAVGLASCAKGTIDDPKTLNGDSGYLAIRIDLEKQRTRSSSEDPGLTEESELKSVYLVTFTSAGAVVAIPDGGYYINLDATQLLAAQQGSVFLAKVAGSSRRIMALANPGPKLLAALNGLGGSSTFASFNTAITGERTLGAIIDIKHATRGFAMISCASDASLSVAGKIDDAMVDIVPAVVDGTTYANDAAAMAAAQANPVRISIERLATKIVFKPVPAVGSGLTVLPAGATFTFEKWTLDVLNELFLPFAKKTIIGKATDHTGTHYKYNFYTEDPNYLDVAPPACHTGLAYATINATTKDVELPWSSYAGWLDDQGANAFPRYLTENTMEAAAQRYGNATRIVIKGRYAPAGFTAGADWFSFGGKNYQTLADLKTAFGDAAATPELKAACEAFAIQMGATDFASLTDARLSAKANGGEWAKVPKTGVGIRYYQHGLNYWFYEIRHNGEANGTMEYSKYGIVRNNWYNCTLNKVSGPGTPWYPDPRNPGDGDPDPWTPIDDAYGYIGIVITPAPWIVWENGMTI